MNIEKGERYFNSINDLSDRSIFNRVGIICNAVCSSVLVAFLYCALFVLYMLLVLIVAIILSSVGIDVTGMSAFYISSIVIGPYLSIPVFLISTITIIKKSRNGYGRYLRMCGFEIIKEDANGKYILM